MSLMYSQTTATCWINSFYWTLNLVNLISLDRLKMMNVILQPAQEQFIQEKLKSGKYKTAYEVIVEALQLLEERGRNYEKWVEETREKVAVGLEQLDRGEGIDGEVVVARLRDKLRKARESQG